MTRVAESFMPLFGKYRNLIFILAVIYVIYAGVLSNSRILNVDLMEARNFVTAREMIDTGNWLIPSMNGELRIAKPPLPTWLTAFAMTAAGTDLDLFYNRLPAGFASLLLLYFLFSFVRSLSGKPDVAMYSTLALSTSYMFMYMSRKGTWDIFCHSFMLGGIWLLYECLKTDKRRYGFFAGAGILMGLSWLSKGPVSFYALLLPFIIGYVSAYGFKSFKGKSFGMALLVVLCLAVSIVWPVYVYLHSPDMASGVAVGEAQAWMSRHMKPFWYYLQFPAMSGIWLFMMLPLLWMPYGRKVTGDIKSYKFLFFWVIFIFILLSVIPEKKDRYLLPITIPMSVMLGYFFSYLGKMFERQRCSVLEVVLVRLYFYLSLVFTVLIVGASVYYVKNFHQSPYLIVMTAVGLVSAFTMVMGYRAKDARSLFIGVFLVMATLVASLAPLGGEMSKDKDFMALVPYRGLEELAKQDLYMTNINMKLVWAMGRQIKNLDGDIVDKLRSGDSLLILNNKRMSDADIPNMRDGIHLDLLKVIDVPDENKEWVIYRLWAD